MTHPAESTHWYSREGKPAYEVPYADPSKGMRPTTLSDAKKLGLFPSVTTILRESAKPGLERWKQEQVLLSALTLPRIEGELDTDYMARVFRDSQEQGKKAAERGTEIHAAIEGRKTFGKYGEHVMAAQKEIYLWDNEIWKQEESFFHRSGFGGKVDDHTDKSVIDYKTTDKPLETLKTWDEHAMQLAAYREGLMMPNARCAIVYVHAITPQARLIEIPEKDLQRGWNMFRALLDYWYAKTGLMASLGEAANRGKDD